MQKLKRNRPTIGVLVGWNTFPGTVHSFVDNVFRGIQTAAHNYDCNILFGCGVGSPFNNFTFPAMPIATLPGVDFIPVGPWNTDGLLVLGPLLNNNLESYFQGLVDSGFPLVYTGNNEIGPSVTVNNEDGIAQAIEHLIDHGHQQIAFLSGHETKHGDSAARMRGFRNELKRHGLPYDPELVALGQHSHDASYQAMKGILEKGKPFTAVIASNDESAIGAISALSDHGLLVPQDIAVIGFDDRTEARANIPLLTTVHLPMFELGYQSLELLIHIIQGISSPNTLLQIPTHLVIRETCGCLPGEIPSGNKYRGKSNNNSSNHLHGNTSKNSLQPFSPHFPRQVEEGLQLNIAREMANVVYKEMLRLGKLEIEYLCKRLLGAYMECLENGDAASFRQAVQQILEHVVSLDDDLYTWQSAITVLKEWTPVLIETNQHSLSKDQAENLLHQARITINETSRGQYARKVVNETNVSNRLNQMSSRFFAAQTESEVFDIFSQELRLLGIQQASVVYYSSQGEDPVALSEVKMPLFDPEDQKVFRTRDFPLAGIFQADRPFQLAILPIFGPDQIIGHTAYQFIDISYLGKVTRQLASALHNVRLYQEAVSARKMAEEANNLKNRFLSIVSHELRTPLNLIIGLSNMMLIENENTLGLECQVDRKDLERVFIGAQHLESLIHDVLDLAQVDMGQLKLSFEEFDVRELLHPIIEIGQQFAHDKDLTWSANIMEAPLVVNGDRTRLRQVVLNLINNAVKFTMHGGITLSATTENNQIIICVSDTGLGIPLEEQEKIFDEFQQSTRTSARGFGGLGLGLAICKNLIHLHGGMIGVYSSGHEGAGSTFYIKLPAQPIVTGLLPSPYDEDRAEYYFLLSKDSPDNKKIISDLLSQGHSIQVKTIGKSPDWLPGILAHHPEKIILDINLPLEISQEVVQILKNHPAIRDIPILFFSIDNEQNKGSLLEIDFKTKPLEMTELASILLKENDPTSPLSQRLGRPILIVDDDEEILELHSRMVETLSFNSVAIKARNGREALEVIKKHEPALILLDLMMPVMNGFEFIEALSIARPEHNIPIVILSSQSLTQEDMHRLNHGVVSVMKKGMFTAEETLQHLNTALCKKPKTNLETKQIILKAMAYIHCHYPEQITRSEIASHVGLSERHLTRCFNQEVGLTPMTYLNRYRVHQAKLLLIQRKKGITDIALDVGFTNSGYFTRVFHDEVGMSPREYSQSH